MNCPICNVQLKPIRYSGIRIFSCKKCSGHLIENGRAKTIEKRIDKDMKSIVQEIAHRRTEDLKEIIRCPRCRNRMDKQEVKAARVFQQDSCRNCDAIWLDGGELAEIQLAYESNEQTQQVNRMRARLENMTEREKAEFEARISELVECGDALTEATREATWELIAFYYWRGFLTL